MGCELKFTEGSPSDTSESLYKRRGLEFASYRMNTLSNSLAILAKNMIMIMTDRDRGEALEISDQILYQAKNLEKLSRKIIPDD